MSDKVIGCFAVLFRLCRDPSPLQVVWASLAGSAQARTSPVQIINQYIAEVSRCMTTSPVVVPRSTRTVVV